MILDAASAVISQNRNRKDKRLWTDRKGGSRIVYFRGNDELEEADFIARTIKQARSADVDSMVAVLYRTNAQSRAIEDSLMRESDPLQDHRRRPLLRAQGDQGRARLPEADHQPARRRQPAAGDQRAGARHRQGRDGFAAGDRPRRRRRGCAAAAGRRPAGSDRRRGRSGRGCSTPMDEGRLANRAVTALCATFRDLIAGAGRRRPPGRRCRSARQDARSDRLPERSARREQRRGQRAHREPDGARLGGAGLRDARAGAVARRLRRSAVAAVRSRRGVRQPQRPGLDDDDARGQGPRVPDGGHRRARRGPVSALALGRRRGGARRRAAALLRRHDARAAAAGAHRRGAAPGVRRIPVVPSRRASSTRSRRS